MGKGKKTLEEQMETALEKAAYRHLKYLSENPDYADWWGSAENWDWDEIQWWYSEDHPASVSHSSRPLGKGKRGRGYPQPAEEPLGKGSSASNQGSKRASSSLEKDTTPEEAPEEEGWWRDPSNAEKEGTYKGPVNNKEKSSGSGTTSDARRKRRLGKQWDALEKAAAAHKPDSEESMDTHIEQLHKALEKARERKEQLRGTSPSPGGAGPQGPDPSQDKGEGPWKRSRRRMPRSPGRSGGTGASAWESMGPEWMWMLPRQPWKRQGKNCKPTWKQSLQRPGRPSPRQSPPPRPGQNSKRNWSRSSPWKRKLAPALLMFLWPPWKRMWPPRQRKKARVCVDWRNTLEKDNHVPADHIQHLRLLMEQCQVLICSYVKTKWREQEVKKQVLALEKDMGLVFHFPLFFTYEKQGAGGKLEKMWYQNVDYIIDDSWQVLKETLEKGYPHVTPIAVQTPEQSHWRFQGQEGITVVPDFPAAVMKVLQDLEVRG